jgi:hypothetical protein
MVSVENESFDWKIRSIADISAQDPRRCTAESRVHVWNVRRCTFLYGFGVAIAHGASPLLITELVHPQHRAIYTAIYNTTWYIGSLVAAWLTFGESRCPSVIPLDNEFLLNLWQVPIKSTETELGEHHRSCKSFLLLFK